MHGRSLTKSRTIRAETAIAAYFGSIRRGFEQFSVRQFVTWVVIAGLQVLLSWYRRNIIILMIATWGVAGAVTNASAAAPNCFTMG